MLIVAFGAAFAVPWMAIQVWVVWLCITSQPPLREEAERADVSSL